MDHRVEIGKICGVRGWLVFYVVVTAVGIAANAPAIHDYFADNLPATGFALVTILLAQAFGMALIFFCRSPVTRLFHVGLYAALLTAVILGSLVSGQPQDPKTVLGTGIWLAYWLFSERVRATYRRPSSLPDSPTAG